VGGAIRVSSNGAATVRRSFFINAKATNGGAIAATASGSATTTLMVEECEFTGCSASEARSMTGGMPAGGAVFIRGASPASKVVATVSSAIFLSNSVDLDLALGGAVAVAGPADSLAISFGTFLRNSASVGASVYAGRGASVAIDTTSFALENAKYGGAVYAACAASLNVSRATLRGVTMPYYAIMAVCNPTGPGVPTSIVTVVDSEFDATPIVFPDGSSELGRYWALIHVYASGPKVRGRPRERGGRRRWRRRLGAAEGRRRAGRHRGLAPLPGVLLSPHCAPPRRPPQVDLTVLRSSFVNAPQAPNDAEYGHMVYAEVSAPGAKRGRAPRLGCGHEGRVRACTW
jgi:hypothetical protein